MKTHSKQPWARPGSALFLIGAVLAVGVIVHCGSGSSPTPPSSVTTLAPTTTTTTAPAGTVLPSGMVCSPTPPPLHGMQLKIFGGERGRYVLDSKPIVINVDGYCERINGHSGKFCETRPENDPQRAACDYLVVGLADSGRWGPSWYWTDKPCDGANSDACRNHPDNQFMAIAKVAGKYEACASSKWPLSDDGSRCGGLDVP